MALIEEIITPEISSRISEFKTLGGVVDFKIFKVSGVISGPEAHLLIAQHTLELLAQDADLYFERLAAAVGANRDNYFKIVNSPVFKDSGVQIQPERFFGPYFNFKEQRPILLGKTGKIRNGITVFTDYYYYDDIESSENIVLVKHNENNDFAIQGYTDAFLNPPHSFGRKGMANYNVGKFFLEFNDFLFDDVNDIVIYSWPTDCSNYFDDGKEWWGSFFWTVYNPVKDWHLGIAASSTD